MSLDLVKDNLAGMEVVDGLHPLSGGAPCTSNRLPANYYREVLHASAHWS